MIKMTNRMLVRVLLVHGGSRRAVAAESIKPLSGGALQSQHDVFPVGTPAHGGELVMEQVKHALHLALVRQVN